MAEGNAGMTPGLKPEDKAKAVFLIVRLVGLCMMLVGLVWILVAAVIAAAVK